MKLIQTVTLAVVTLILPILALTFTADEVAAINCKSNQIEVKVNGKKECKPACGGVQTSILSCGGKKDAKTVEDSGIWHILLLVLNIMTGGVALLAIGGFIYGAILYATAEDKAAQVSQAKQTIFNVIVGLVLFALMYALLQFLIPGGIFA